MSAFKEHFLDRYFGYRARYVAAVAERVPARRSWAVASEVARLTFVIFGATFCAVLFWLLTVAATHRTPLLPLTFALCAAAATALSCLAFLGLTRAVGELRRLPRK